MNQKELQLILEEGEGHRIEFKESLNNIDRELVAFANASGGRVFLGITDDKKVKHLTIDNKLKSQIQDIANNCQPTIKISFEEFNKVLIINAREGDDKPYKCSSGFYLRGGPNSQKLNRDEIVAFIKSEGKVRFDELVCAKFNYKQHFDPQKLDKLLLLSGISKLLDNQTMLVNLDVAEKQEGRIMVNNTGALFFSKKLSDIYFHTAVTCALYKGTEKVQVLDRRDFNDDLISSIEGAMVFLKQYIPVRYEMTGSTRRKEVPEIPYDALREALINAVVHRDYFEKGANVMVEMFDDRIEITNPGGLVKGLKPADFGKKSALRNPTIASLLHHANYIEKMGTGISKIRKLMKEAKLSPPKFAFNTFFTVTFKRPYKKEKKIEAPGAALYDVLDRFIREPINEPINEPIKKRLSAELSHIYRNGFITLSIMEQRLDISRATAKRDIDILKNAGLIEYVGSRKAGRYMLTEKGTGIMSSK